MGAALAAIGPALGAVGSGVAAAGPAIAQGASTAAGALGSAAGAVGSGLLEAGKSVGGALKGAIGSTGSLVEGAHPEGFTGPMPATGTPPSGIIGGLSSVLGKIKNFTDFLGDTPEEKERNAQKFAALAKDINNTMKDVNESTLMQRLMKEASRRDITVGPQGISGGFAMPKTLDSGIAQAVMSQLGFR